MIRKFLSALAMVASMSVFAGQVVISDTELTDAQKSQLRAQAAQMSAANQANKDGSVIDTIAKDPEKALNVASTWGQQAAQAAKGFAEALGIAAHELNINVNEFLNTPAGKLTAALIIWKVAGVGIMHFLFGFAFTLVGWLTARVLYLRLFTKETVTVESTWLWGAFKTTHARRIPKSFKELSNDGEWLVFWVMMACLIGSTAIGGAIMIP